MGARMVKIPASTAQSLMTQSVPSVAAVDLAREQLASRSAMDPKPEDRVNARTVLRDTASGIYPRLGLRTRGKPISTAIVSDVG
jgi:hypothetical protein